MAEHVEQNSKLHEHNWAGNIAFSAARIEPSSSIQALRELICSQSQVKGLGSRHSFTPIADTTGTLIEPRLGGNPFTLDASRHEISIQAGARYGEIAEYLWQRGYALRNLASLPHISVVGACATATHGSGVTNGNLATAVRAFEIVTGSGELRTVSPANEGERFNGLVVHLGALGVVTAVTLEVVPAFEVAQTVYENLPLEVACSNFDTMMTSAYSVSFFTTWATERIEQVWLKERVENRRNFTPRLSFFGAPPAQYCLHPVGNLSAVSCTPQRGVPGPWHERLPHFNRWHNPSVGNELQTEYFVSRHDAPEALRRLAALRETIAPLVLVSEIRAIAADSLWMSPQYKRDCVGIHFTWRPDLPGVLRTLPVIEAALDDLSPTPHWAKLSTMAPEKIRSRFPRLPEFQQLMREFDPSGRFRNDFLARLL
jgi:xylitol oxidase